MSAAPAAALGVLHQADARQRAYDFRGAVDRTVVDDQDLGVDPHGVEVRSGALNALDDFGDASFFVERGDDDG
ncbi:MAG: hypothetical protein R2724_09685 [Bryobacterales bacterium]